MGRSPLHRSQLLFIEAESKKLQEQLPQLPKEAVRKHILKIWARARKVGFGFFRDVAYDLVKEGFIVAARTALNTDLYTSIKGFLGLGS